jgi:TolA-binding protein
MSDHPLARAARALRESHDGSSPQATSSRRQILAKAPRRRRRHRLFAAVWMPLAAVLVVSSAWAAVSGRLSHVWPWLHAAPPAAAPERRVAAELPQPSESESALAPSATPSVTPSPTVTASPPPSTPTVAIAATSRSPARPAPPRPDAEEALYFAAHQAHFVARDPAAALKGWNEYLSAYPQGRFAPEARYNLALTLVRLGRTDEARAALAPFADGRNGGYRQTEARALLDALDAGP